MMSAGMMISRTTLETPDSMLAATMAPMMGQARMPTMRQSAASISRWPGGK
jgi:hypothetical protein